MATVDSSLYYPLALGIIFTAACILTNITIETVSAKLGSILKNPQKDALQEPFPSPGAVTAEASTLTPKFSPSWWTSKEIFQLERRAIFSKTWLFVTHAGKFRNSGDYRTFEVAGFSFIVILGKDNQIRAFHNICRHRAYAVTKKECGTSTVLRCRYHGWSYDSRGKLIKAPEFDDVKGFEKNLNGLWEIRTEIRESMIFVNLDVDNEVTSQVLGGIETSLRRWMVNEMVPVEEWKIEGSFNWKLAAGSLFCSDSRKKGLSAFLPFLPSDEYLGVFHTSIFRRLSSGQLLTLRLLPLSKNTTMVECNLYGPDSKSSGKRINSCKMEVQATIKNLERQQYMMMHNCLETSDSKQESIKKLIQRHKNAEESLGAEIHPAARKQSLTEDGREDDELCRELELGVSKNVSLCSAKADGILDW